VSRGQAHAQPVALGKANKSEVQHCWTSGQAHRPELTKQPNAGLPRGRYRCAIATSWPASGDKEIVELLLAHGAEVDARDDDGFTALLVAAEMGRVDTVQTLLDHKADVNAKTNDGRAALYLTVRGKAGQTENDLKVLEILISHRAEIDAENNGMTALDSAACTGRVAAARLLLEAKAA